MPHTVMARKKGPGLQLSVVSIVVCIVVIIVIILSALAIHKHKTKGGVDLLEDLRNYDIIWSKTSDTAYGGIKPDRLPKRAIFNTTKGSFTVELFPQHAPKTVLNFVSHSKNGYYDGVIFHRVIKNFMVQSGDPKGDGTGGKSIWGGGFGDEFHEELKHEPFTLSMANLGRPNTNRSQFFITTDVGSPHLDNKYTVFGRVIDGKEIVMDIEGAETDADDRPLDPIVIHNIAVVDDEL